MAPHPLAVHHVHDEGAARGQRALHRLQHREIVFRPVEIAERVAEHADAMKFPVAEPEAARVAFVECHLQIALPGALAGEADQVARAVEPGDMLKAALRQFERVPSLTAAQIEDAIVAFETGATDQKIGLLLRVAIVLDDVAIGFEIERVEQRAPPFGWQVALEIGHRSQRAQPRSVLVPGRRAIGPRRWATPEVELGRDAIAVRFLPHFRLPPRTQKRAASQKGEPPRR